MDTAGSSQIGRYGTLSLVKRATTKSANPNNANANRPLEWTIPRSHLGVI